MHDYGNAGALINTIALQIRERLLRPTDIGGNKM